MGIILASVNNSTSVGNFLSINTACVDYSTNESSILLTILKAKAQIKFNDIYSISY
jgi:hypothetical protein